MSLSPRPPLLEELLRTVARRYRIPAIPGACAQRHTTGPAATLAVAIEHARLAMVRAEAPNAALKQAFLEALARMIHDAMRAEHGDPVFQAMVLRHRLPLVREYASLSAHADRDRRLVRATVDAIAHPGKVQGRAPAPYRLALTQLHALASSASWAALGFSARQLLHMQETSNDPPLLRGLQTLLDKPALARLQRLAELAPDEFVQRHQALLDRNGPRSGSSEATAQGWTARRRGAAVEALAAQALDTLAQRLNQSEGTPDAYRYRVVTSMRVPASIPGNAERAKTEWDAVLLQRAQPLGSAPVHGTHRADDSPPAAAGSTRNAGGFNETAAAAERDMPGHRDAGSLWDICLLVEAKASIDATATDFPRLLRGLRLLACADETAVYPFATRQGVVYLRGTSLNALSADTGDLAGTVLYCCDVPADATPRLLSAASRMQLLSAQASLAYAGRLAARQPVDHHDLQPVWQALLQSPQWHGVLHQYATLRRACELAVHVGDLAAATIGSRIEAHDHGTPDRDNVKR